jgi:hypothetical protein
MRFNLSDWLRLIAAYAVSGLLLVGVMHAGATGLSFSRGDAALLAYGSTVFLATMVQPLAAWLVLRRCVAGLGLTAWLLAAALGLVLGAIAHIPAFALVPSLMGDGNHDALNGEVLKVVVLGLAVIVAGFAFSLPSGLLLRHLSGFNVWPFFLGSTLSIVAAEIAVPTITRWIAYPTMQLVETVPAAAITQLRALLSGVLQGLLVGGGLYLMALQPAPASSDRDV